MEQEKYFAAIDRGYAELAAPELEELLKSLVRKSETEGGARSALHASMLGELGAFYRGQGRFDESERAFLSAVDILGGINGGAGADYATALNNLAGTHRLMGRLDEAEAEFSECMRIYRRTIGEGHVLYASALNNLSLVCLDRGELRHALELQDRAGLILSRNAQARDEYAASLCNTGALYLRLGQYDEAERRLLEAVSLFENELGTDTPHYHAALNTLGIVYYRLGRFAEAYGHFTQAGDAAERLYGPEHRECVSARKNALSARAELEKQEDKNT